MKLTKSILLVLAGVLIASSLFSFKGANNQFETISILNLATVIIINYPDGSSKEIKTKPASSNQDEIKLINELGKDGWEIKAVYSNNGSRQNIYLQRIKQ
jgi:hypothetical protein